MGSPASPVPHPPRQRRHRNPSHPCAAAPPRRCLRHRDSAAPPHQGPVQGAHRLRLDFWSFPGPAALRSDPCINLVTNLRHTPPRDPIAGAATSPLRPLQPLCEHPKAPRLSLRYSNWVVGYSDAPGTARRRCSAAHTCHRRRTRRPEPQSAALSGQVDYACHGDAPRPSPSPISAL